MKLKQIKVGQKWKTRDGRAVIIDSRCDRHPYAWWVVGAIPGKYCVTKDGKYWENGPHTSCDLTELTNDSIKDNMKPFDLEAAKDGAPIQDSRGNLLEFLMWAPGSLGGINVIIRDHEKRITLLSDDGKLAEAYPAVIFMAPIKRTVWVNLYGQQLESACHPTEEEEADKRARPNRIGGKAYPLEIEE